MTEHPHGPPKEVEGQTPKGQPSTTQISGHHTAKTSESQRSAVGQQLRTRRAASQRLPVLASGRSDPWWYPAPRNAATGPPRHTC